MSKKFLVAFSRQSFIYPKLYIRKVLLDKLLNKHPDCEVREFQLLKQAQIFMENKKIQLKAQKRQIKLLNVQKIFQNSIKNQIKDKPTIQQQAVNSQIKDKPIIQQKPINSQIKDKPIIYQNLLSQKNSQFILQKKPNNLIDSNQFKDIIMKHDFKFHLCKQKIDPKMTYSAYFDGASKGNPGNSSIGYYIEDDSMKEILRHFQSVGRKTNNQAQYLSLFFLIIDAYYNGIKKIKIYGDSQLIIRQINQMYDVQSKKLLVYYSPIQKIKQTFVNFQISHLKRSLNKKADYLCNLALSQQGKLSYAKTIKEQQLKKQQALTKDKQKSSQQQKDIVPVQKQQKNLNFIQIKDGPLLKNKNIQEKIY